MTPPHPQPAPAGALGAPVQPEVSCIELSARLSQEHVGAPEEEAGP